MKIVELKCPNCGAAVVQDEEGKKLFCEYCGAKLICSDEPSSVRLDDAEDTGYRFEMGRIRAQREAAQQPLRSAAHQIVINNYNVPAEETHEGTPKNKWVALMLCIFFGYIGFHKFYEGKTGMGILYLFTAGLFCVGWIADIISLAGKPDTYYV